MGPSLISFISKAAPEIIFTLFRMFGCNKKYNFSKITFLLTKIYPFDPEMNLRSHFYFNSFPGHSPRTATQSEREKRDTKQTHTQQHNELPDPHFISPIHSDPRTREVWSTHSNTERKRERAPIHISYLRSTPIHEPERSDPRTATQGEIENELRSSPIHEPESSDPRHSILFPCVYL